jgi:hypothetical protein
MTDIVELVVGTVSSILISAGRSIGGLVPDVTIEEVHRDTTFITNHPVERGAAISDHAFMMPVEVEMRVAWSDSTAGFQGYSRLIYEAIQAIQQRREPFTAVTGKRLYRNMLIASCEVTTNQTSEYALMVRLGLREVIIVGTQTTSLGDPSKQASPQATSAPVDTGAKQLITPPSWATGLTPYL